MIIRVLKQCRRLGVYKVGEIHDVAEEEGNALVEQGLAEEVADSDDGDE